MIEVQNLSKHYGSHEAVRELSFTVPKGQVCGFLGPNGAGKSTTLRMLTGFLTPSAGTIRIGGVDALARPIEARRQIGYMPEACPLYPEMRVAEYLRYRAELKGVPRARIAERVDAALEQATVADVRLRIIGQLSKGYRQRVGLADALVADPPLLVLDEPTAGLDPNQIRQVRDLIKALAKDKTVLLSTHILPEVEAICDRVLILHRGKLVSEGDTRAMRAGSSHKQLIGLEGRGAIELWRGCLEGIAEVRLIEVEARGELVRAQLEADEADAVEAIFAAVVRAGLVLRELHKKEISLEDVFAHLTTDEPAARATPEDEEEPEGDDDDDDEGAEDDDEGAEDDSDSDSDDAEAKR